MSRFTSGALVVALALTTGGCLVRGNIGGGMVATSEPMLVELDSGLWVVEDHSDPVFYTEGFFWLYRDDGWYRSTSHTSGWVRIQSVPRVVVRLERPRQYVHYRAAPGHRTRRGTRGPVIVRDRRDDDKRDKHDHKRPH